MNKFLVLSAIAITLIGCTQKSSHSENNPANDSVQKYLALAENDSLDFKKRVQYNDKALSFIDLRRNDSVVRRSLGRLSKNYIHFNQNKQFINMSGIWLQKIKQSNDSITEGEYYEFKGNYFKKLRVYDSAFNYYSKSEKLFLKIMNYEKAGVVLTKKGIIQLSIDDYLGAELSTKKACSYFKKKTKLFKIRWFFN